MLKHGPADGVCGHKVAEETRCVAQLSRLNPVGERILATKKGLVRGTVLAAELAKAACQEAVKAAVNLLVGAALKDHRGELTLTASGQSHLLQLVAGLLEVKGRLQREVDCPAQVDDVRLR